MFILYLFFWFLSGILGSIILAVCFREEFDVRDIHAKAELVMVTLFGPITFIFATIAGGFQLIYLFIKWLEKEDS